MANSHVGTIKTTYYDAVNSHIRATKTACNGASNSRTVPKRQTRLSHWCHSRSFRLTSTLSHLASTFALPCCCAATRRVGTTSSCRYVATRRVGSGSPCCCAVTRRVGSTSASAVPMRVAATVTPAGFAAARSQRLALAGSASPRVHAPLQPPSRAPTLARPPRPVAASVPT